MALIRERGSDRLFTVINYTFMFLLTAVFIYPLWFVLIASISDPDLVNGGKIYLLPKNITFEGYARILRNGEIGRSYLNTVFYTAFGTVVNVILTLMCAYALSKKRLFGRKVITVFFTFTMFFSGGLIPTYLVVKQMGMINTVWAMIVPGAIGIYYVIIARTFFQSTVPAEIEESAMVDGCTVIYIFLRIVLPLSKALISVLLLFYAVGHWNSYFDALLYLMDRKRYPLQLIMREILIEFQMKDALAAGGMEEDISNKVKAASLIRYGVIIVSSLPVLIIYPMIQKHFASGVMIGSIKG